MYADIISSKNINIALRDKKMTNNEVQVLVHTSTNET